MSWGSAAKAAALLTLLALVAWFILSPKEGSEQSAPPQTSAAREPAAAAPAQADTPASGRARPPELPPSARGLVEPEPSAPALAEPPAWELTPELERARARLQDQVLSMRPPASMGDLVRQVGLLAGRNAQRCLSESGWSLDRIIDADEKLVILLDLADDGLHAAFQWVDLEIDPPAPAVRACFAPLLDGLTLPWQPEEGEVGSFHQLDPYSLTGVFRE